MRACPFCDFDEGWVNEEDEKFLVRCKVCGSQGPTASTHDLALQKWEGSLIELSADEFEGALKEKLTIPKFKDYLA